MLSRTEIFVSSQSRTLLAMFNFKPRLRRCQGRSEKVSQAESERKASGRTSFNLMAWSPDSRDGRTHKKTDKQRRERSRQGLSYQGRKTSYSCRSDVPRSARPYVCPSQSPAQPLTRGEREELQCCWWPGTSVDFLEASRLTDGGAEWAPPAQRSRPDVLLRAARPPDQSASHLRSTETNRLQILFQRSC